ncbi:U-box domain containing protein [Pyrenophora tritici-repentis]|nr:U-box domain containing protein [Pyrenophora tritici-repentis]
MNERCGFEDFEHNEDAFADMQSHTGEDKDISEDLDNDSEDPAFPLPEPGELKESVNLPNPLIWKPGDTMPTVRKVVGQTEGARPSFQIPPEYCCHISNEIMENTVITVDNYTYDRRNIERWLRSNERSPLTDLILTSNDLRPNVQIKEKITSYLNCADIISAHQKSRVHTRASSAMLHVTFQTPDGAHSFDLPRTLQSKVLWEIAFRLTKGRHDGYKLQHRNAPVPASEHAIELIVNPDHEIFINDVVSTAAVPAVNQKTEELCLYRQKFSTLSRIPSQVPLRFWTKLRNEGDGYCAGTNYDTHWKTMYSCFNREFCTGILDEEPCVHKVQNAPINASQPLVFKLLLDTLSTPSNETNHLTRLDVLKQMFDAYINRVLAYSFQPHIGLVTFNTKTQVAQKITNAVENSRHKLNNLAAYGDTAIWDSVALAQDQIQQHAKQYPNAKLRIICISDGEDNTSLNTVEDVAKRLTRCGIVVDSFCLGNTGNLRLQTLSSLTEGYVFAPKTLDEAMAICELEPVLSLLERPPSISPARSRYHHNRFRQYPHSSISTFSGATSEAQIQRVTPDSFPARREYPELQHIFVELGQFAKQVSRNRTNNNIWQTRMHIEIHNSSANPHPHYDI